MTYSPNTMQGATKRRRQKQRAQQRQRQLPTAPPSLPSPPSLPKRRPGESQVYSLNWYKSTHTDADTPARGAQVCCAAQFACLTSTITDALLHTGRRSSRRRRPKAPRNSRWMKWALQLSGISLCPTLESLEAFSEHVLIHSCGSLAHFNLY